MATAEPTRSAKAPSPDSSAAVDLFLRTLEHPFKAEIELLREILRGVDPGIAEGIKWKAPSKHSSASGSGMSERTTTRIGAQ